MQRLCRAALCLDIGLWYSSGYCETLQSANASGGLFCSGQKKQQKQTLSALTFTAHIIAPNTLDGPYILVRPGYNLNIYVFISLPSLGFCVHVCAREQTCTHAHQGVDYNKGPILREKKDCVGSAINCSFVQFTLKL